MADKHAYVASPGQLIEVLDQLKKSFPQTLNAEVLKKLALASSNEGTVINTIRFLGLIDDKNARTANGQRIFTLHDPDEFKTAFAGVIQEAYSELFSLHGDAAWSLDQSKLVTFFRQTDQSTDRVGREQARTFKTLASYAGFGEAPKLRITNRSEKTKPPKKPKPTPTITLNEVKEPQETIALPASDSHQRDFGLTVRIEINLPVAEDQAVYDRIFRSIRENLLEWPKN